MRNDWLSVPLDDLGMLRVQGPDATRFLQGQLSNDMAALSAERSLLAGYHSPQGRVIAILRLVWLAAEDFLVILPRELAPTVAARLLKFVLRAKVKIGDQSSAWRATGLAGPATPESDQPGAVVQSSALELAPDPNGQTTQGASIFVCVGNAPPRWLTLSPVDSPVNEVREVPLGIKGVRDKWRQLDIAAGLPQVYAATSEEFVAQMLNLDVLNAISFDKGCYTGQEVVARAHYRGRVKRRLQRFSTHAAVQLVAGSAGKLADGRAFKVVDAVRLDDGRCEFLAVAPLLVAETAASRETASAETEAGEVEADDAPQPTDTSRIEANQLPLPYSLPE